jgi:hypothetical protein
MLQKRQIEVTFIPHPVNPLIMKALRATIAALMLITVLSSCSVWNRVFPPKYGCGTDGKNVGAEKLLDGSNQKKQPKFKA